MSNYNWCHNPSCHTIETQSRVRGSGNNKVLRTRKIRVHNPDDPHVWNYFCNQSCLFGFISHFLNEMVNINPVNKPSETPIKIEKTKEQSYRYNWNGNGSERVPYTSTRTTISLKNSQE